jgi:uncharacterized protein YdhG (YjbR/CyaY superfamily)
MSTQIHSKEVDMYISAQPENARVKLEELRQTIRKAAPDAEELISYSMPAFKQNGMLVYYASFKNHIGFYPAPSGIEVFKKELSGYKVAKGSVQFPIDKKLPAGLITKIVKFRVKENLDKAKKKAVSKSINN